VSRRFCDRKIPVDKTRHRRYFQSELYMILRLFTYHMFRAITGTMVDPTRKAFGGRMKRERLFIHGKMDREWGGTWGDDRKPSAFGSENVNEEMTAEDLRSFFKKDLFAAFIGIELLDAGEGRATARLKLRDHHRNGLGIVHGGALFTLADLTFAAAVNSHGRTAVAIHCAISYIKAAQGDCLIAEAGEVSCGPKIAVYNIRITDSSGELVSTFEGMAYRKKERWTL
jgi:acyl-CoA thioesterase